MVSKMAESVTNVVLMFTTWILLQEELEIDKVTSGIIAMIVMGALYLWRVI